jgi:hypothetical protein
MFAFISLNPTLRLSQHNLYISRDDPKIVMCPECAPNIIVRVSKPSKTVSPKNPFMVL